MHDFNIRAQAVLSQAFLQQNITRFSEALAHVKQWPYQRNTDKNNLPGVFNEQRGTCGTKHAVLCALARENQQQQVQLMLGMFKMNARNTPKLRVLLEQHQLAYIPEAHNYLLIQGERIDVTMPGTPLDFVPDLLYEMPIDPADIGEVKVKIHQQFLQEWLQAENIPYSLAEIWNIREACIMRLAQV